MSTSEPKSEAGRSLVEAVRSGREFQHNQSRFQAWLGAFNLARHVVEPLSRSPGMQEMNGAALRSELENLVRTGTHCASYLEKRLAEKADPVDISHPAHRLQIRRMVFETLAEHWPREDSGFFSKAPNGTDFNDYEGKAKLFFGYLNIVSEQIERENDAIPGYRAFAEDYRLDRLLAVHSVYRVVDRFAQPFFADHIADATPQQQALLMGSRVNERGMNADEFTQAIITEANLPTVDRRHGEIMAAFDPGEAFSAEDRHIAYRALLHNTSADAGLIVENEQSRLIEHCEAVGRDANEAVNIALQGGLLIDWLVDRLNYRLDRVYPRVDEYV